VKGIVIAGGLGTRLRPLTLTRPKPLMPLVGAPLLEYQIYYLRSAGIEEVCFATNYLAEEVEKFFGDGSAFGVRLLYAREEEPLGTGGAIRNAFDAFPEKDDCVIFNGDTIHAFNISEIIDGHRQRNADVTLTLKEVRRPHPYGVVPLDKEGRVLGFLEPTDEQKRSLQSPKEEGTDFINAGLYIISREVLEAFPKGPSSVERDVFPALIREGRRVFGCVQKTFWIDIGRPVQYLEAVRAVVKGWVPSPRPLSLTGDSVVAKSSRVEEGAKIEDASVVGEKVTVGKGACLRGSVILEGAKIGEGTVVERSIIGEGCVIGQYCHLSECVLAPGTHLPDYTLAGNLR
jgi:mannose-1-phosphate guanylyltransferase